MELAGREETLLLKLKDKKRRQNFEEATAGNGKTEDRIEPSTSASENSFELKKSESEKASERIECPL